MYIVMIFNASLLLAVLSNRINPSEGIVKYAGVPITDNIAQGVSAFVQQLDLFINHLSVHEHLYAQVCPNWDTSMTQ